MSRKTKRIIGNVSVLTALVALVAVLVFAATNPNLLKNDAKLTAEANEGTPIVQATSEPKATNAIPADIDLNSLSESDIEKIKQAAIDSGRPESAWDKTCITWKLPSGNKGNQDWANKLGNKWLESHNSAGCPDAITWPSYYVESWGSSQDGELTVYAEDTESTEWVGIAQDFMCVLSNESSLNNVQVMTTSGVAKARWSRSDLKESPVC